MSVPIRVIITALYGAGDPDATAAARFTGMNILSGVHAASADQVNAVNDRFDVVDLKDRYDACRGHPGRGSERAQ